MVSWLRDQDFHISIGTFKNPILSLTEEERNLILKSQKVLTGRVFDSKIQYKPGMSEQIQFVQYQEWLYLFKTRVPIDYKADVKDFFFIIEFVEDISSLTGMVHEVEIFLNKVSLGEILDFFINEISSVQDKLHRNSFIVVVN